MHVWRVYGWMNVCLACVWTDVWLGCVWMDGCMDAGCVWRVYVWMNVCTACVFVEERMYGVCLGVDERFGVWRVSGWMNARVVPNAWIGWNE